MPADIPVTTPLLLIVAIEELLLLHTPPSIELIKVDVEPTHTVEDPVILGLIADGFIVTFVDTLLIHPLLFVTV